MGKMHRRRAKWVEAEEIAVDDLVAAARRRALAGSDRLLMLLLRVYRPEVYDRRRAVTNSSAAIEIRFNGKARSITGASDLTDEELDGIILCQGEGSLDMSQ